MIHIRLPLCNSSQWWRHAESFLLHGTTEWWFYSYKASRLWSAKLTSFLWVFQDWRRRRKK